MEKNFELHGQNELILDDRRIDIHNLYAPSELGTDSSGDILSLSFRRDHRVEAASPHPETVILTCSGDVKIAFNDLALTPGALRNEAVEFGYLDADCGWDEFLDEALAAAQGYEGLHIAFSGGLVLRIRAGIAMLSARD